MNKERALQIIVDYVLSKEVDKELLEHAINEISDSRPKLQELQVIVGEENNFIDNIDNRILCSDVSYMLPELAEMKIDEIQNKYPNIWQHLSACESCQESFLIINSTIENLIDDTQSELVFTKEPKIQSKKWKLTDIKKHKNDPIFYVVKGWLKSLPFSDIVSQSKKINLNFDNLPEIDEKGRFRMTISVFDKETINKNIKIELRDDLYRLELCEIPNKGKSTDIVLDFSFFSLEPTSFPPEAIHITPVTEAWFINFLKDLCDKQLRPIDFVDCFSEGLAYIDKPLDEVLEQEISIFPDQDQLIDIIKNSKEKIENYVQTWEICNKEKPYEQKFVQILSEYIKKLQKHSTDNKPDEQITTIVSRRQLTKINEKVEGNKDANRSD